jgi:hypothetical protein
MSALHSSARLLALGLFLLGLCPATPAGAAESLDLGPLAKDLKALLKAQGQKDIAVGEFTGPPGQQGGGGAGLQQGLIAALKAVGVGIDAGANLYVKGDYLFDEDSDRDYDRSVLRVMLTVRDKRGKPLLDLEKKVRKKKIDKKVEIRNLREQIKAAGGTTSFPLNFTNADAAEEFYKRLKKPSVHLAGTRIQAVEGSPYSIEIRARKGRKGRAAARKPTLGKKGLAFVALAPGELYEIHIKNNSRFDVAVSVHIDGLDTFTFSDVKNETTGRPLYSHYVIPAGSEDKIKGWHRDNDKVDAFEVTGFGESEAAKLLKGNATVGTITVLFHPAWKGKKPPDGARSAAGDLGTKRGPPLREKRKEVRRTIGALREAISVRYHRKK